MRYEPLVFICIMSAVLSTSAQPSRQKNCKKDDEVCDLSLKSTKLACHAANEAKAAKEAQRSASEEAGQRAMDRLADKAEQAARAAEAALNGKAQLLEQLEQSLCEADAIIEEIKKALVHGRSTVETLNRLAENLKSHLEVMQIFFKEYEMDLGRISEVAENTKLEMTEKLALVNEMDKRVQDLAACLERARKDLCITEKIAKKAAEAAQEALQRVEMVGNVFNKLKVLKKKDIKSLKRVIEKFSRM